MALSADTLVRMDVARERASKYLPYLTGAMRRFDITTQRRAECFLAQLWHESAALQFFEEIASGAAYEGRKDLGNTQPGDGRRYKGRGPIQLTGRGNYRRAGAALGVDLEARPTLVATPRYGFLVAAWFWSAKGLNALADQDKFEEITRRINGAATAGPPSHHTRRVAWRKRFHQHDVRPGKSALARGAEGAAVLQLTRRLSYVHSAKTGARYLDGKRRKFDLETERALKRFQREHGLAVDGECGAKTAKALARAVARRKKERTEAAPVATAAPAQNGTSAHRPHRTPGPRRSSAQLIARLDRIDSRRDRTVESLVRRGVRLERFVAEAERRAATLDVASVRGLADELAQFDAAMHRFGETLARAAAAPAAAEPQPVGALAPDKQANGDVVTAPATLGEIATRLREHDDGSDGMRALLAERVLLLEARADEVAPRRHKQAEPVKDATPTKPVKVKPARGPAFRLTTPLMKNAHIADFQRVLNRQFAAWKVDLRVEVDGEYGPETRDAVRQVMFGLGIATKALEDGVTPELRQRIRRPESRTRTELARARKRREWIRRLRRRHDGGGPAAALAYARRQLGVREDAGRPNRGKAIDKWNVATGIPPGPNAFWCGAFVNACLIGAGFPPDHVLAYCPAIEDRAQQGRDGWSWHAKPKPGDLALFTHRYPDGRLDAGHVGIVERVEGNAIVTIEGNTSPNTTSNNGIGVFRRRRPLPVRGFARPPYKR